MGKKKNTFENNMEQLELIIKELEQGNVSLEDMVKKYGEGMMLAKNCIEKFNIFIESPKESRKSVTLFWLYFFSSLEVVSFEKQ